MNQKMDGKPADKRVAGKEKLHPRSKHRERYDFNTLIKSHAALSAFVGPNKYGDLSIDFSNSQAVLALNTALLKFYYGVKYWALPKGYLCPPIPGRADYVHHMADLMATGASGMVPKGVGIRCLDIGTGANLIYPIIARSEYAWTCVGSDIDTKAFKGAQDILSKNPYFNEAVSIRLQPQKDHFFNGIWKEGEKFDLTICNPPFHSSQEEAQAGSLRKVRNLGARKAKSPVLNFGGQPNELWYEGGEKAFITKMIYESRNYGSSCFWFSSLVSKQAHVKSLEAVLKKVKALEVRQIPMGQGNKSSRLIAWSFLKRHEQEKWARERWTQPKKA